MQQQLLQEQGREAASLLWDQEKPKGNTVPWKALEKAGMRWVKQGACGASSMANAIPTWEKHASSEQNALQSSR